MYDPLQPERISKSQASSIFPAPKFVSFDLWGTLYTPKEPVADQYYRISKGEFGLDKLLESIRREFPVVHSKMLEQFPNYGKLSEQISSSDDWWLELIIRLYGLPHYLENFEAKQLCQRLLHVFSSKEAYKLYDDVVPVLETLKRHNVKMVASSNSDDRVHLIMKSLDIDKYFTSVYLSYDLGHSKPDRAFFRQIFQKNYEDEHSTLRMPEYLQNVWHIGDSYEKDFVGSIKSGWNGVLLDRKRKSIFFKNGTAKKEISNDCFEGQSIDSLDSDDMVMIADNRVAVTGLTQLLTLFELS